MRTRRGMRPLAVAGLLALLGPAPAARAEEKVIPVEQVPRAVIRAAKAKFPGVKIDQASEEAEGGKSVYSLGMKHQRHDLDVTFQANGTVVLVETDLSKKELPKAVLRAVAQQYPGARVRRAGAFRKGPEVKKAADYYEFYLLTADNRPRRLKVDPKGKILEDPLGRLRRTQARPALSPAPGPFGPMTPEDW